MNTKCKMACRVVLVASLILLGCRSEVEEAQSSSVLAALRNAQLEVPEYDHEAWVYDEDELSERPNVILIVIDTLRADHLTPYGYPRPVSPAIQSLADRGVVFEHALATAPYTTASTASIMTGVLPSVHQAVGIRDSISQDVPTLAETLKAEGYQTVGFYRNDNVRGALGFGRGFDEYSNPNSDYLKSLNNPLTKLPATELF